MEIDFNTLRPGERYKVLASLVTPRPIAWVTTVDGTGRVNAAPFSFFNVFGSNPPIVAFAPGNKSDAARGVPAVPKDTARNIRETKEFVVNLVDETVGEAMVQTAAELEHGVSEIEAAGLHTAPSTLVGAPRILESPVAFECREWSTLEVGSNRLVIGTVHHVHVRDGILDPETLRLNPGQFAPLGRMASPDWYCKTGDQFEMPRPE
ncbi:MAG: flavin reductase family protein [Akkermansiaceae bacterium]|jgi:flavin reductase (DIM6/NTAB) family NADH-FMN oxidoreductase RutF|nr:flavin reductase family protein [Akkermansiaceae bacterium]